MAESSYIIMERKRIHRLKVVLAGKGMTNIQLADILNKDSAVISKWVTNVAQPNVKSPSNRQRNWASVWMICCGQGL